MPSMRSGLKLPALASCSRCGKRSIAEFLACKGNPYERLCFEHLYYAVIHAWGNGYHVEEVQHHTSSHFVGRFKPMLPLP